MLNFKLFGLITHQSNKAVRTQAFLFEKYTYKLL